MFLYCVCRVRIEILRSLGTRLTNGKRVAYCVATQAKPYLSVGPAVGNQGIRRSYRFVEAIKKFGCLLEDANLDRAYERAGMNFSGNMIITDQLFTICSFRFLVFLGRLEMLFLVLTEKGATEYQSRRETVRANNNSAPYAVPSKRSGETPGGPPSKR